MCVGGVNRRSTPPGGHFLTPTPVEHFRPPPGQQVVPGPKAPYKSPIPSKWTDFFSPAAGYLRLHTASGSILVTIFIFLVTILQNPGHTPHFKLFHSPAFAPPAELNQASKMLCWEIPSPLEENPTHTYAVNPKKQISKVINHLHIAFEVLVWRVL